MLRGFFNFRFRLNAAIFLVCVTATVTGLVYYYRIASTQVWTQMANRVQDFGKIGAATLTSDDIKFLEHLDADLNASPRTPPPIPVQGARITALAENEKHAIARRMAFQIVVQKLRRIRRASGKHPVYDATLTSAASAAENAQIHRVWIAGIGIHEHAPQFLRVLVGDEFEEIDRNHNNRIDPEESIYQIGDVFNGQGQKSIALALSGKPAVTSGYRTESSGVYISGYTPIKNAHGKIIALLVIDFSAATEFDALFDLKIAGYYIVMGVLLFSIIAAAVIAKLLVTPLEKMQQAAVRISQRDFSVRLVHKSRDEFADLALAMNSMATELGEYSATIERRIALRTREISGILDSLEQGILTLDAHGIIQAEYSKAALEIFAQGELANRKLSSLFSDAALVAAIDKYLELFFQDHEISASMLAMANPLREIDFHNTANVEKHLRFTFRPLSLVDSSAGRRVLVSIVDDTNNYSLRKKIDRAEAEKRIEFDFIVNLMRVPPAILENLLSQQSDFLQRGKSLIATFESASREDLVDFARRVHALKGNALQLSFDKLGEALHALEAKLLIKINGEPHDLRALRHEVSQAINACEAQIVDRTGLVGRMRAITGDSTSDDAALRIRQLASFWISQIEKKAAACEIPVAIDVQFAPGTEAALHALHNALVQLLRNTFAHGIESPEIRRQASKNPELAISITTRRKRNSTLLKYFEDGKGFGAPITATPMELKEFVQNRLTSAPVSATLESGRGLGMQYITTTITDLGGTSEIFSEKNGIAIEITLPI